MSIKALRVQFPIFSPSRHKPLVYLDNAATTHKPHRVIEAISTFYAHDYATVHRGLYDMSEHATERYEATRRSVANFINAAHDRSIVFTKGTTESINLVATAWGSHHLAPGDEILISQAEHHANLVPWQHLARVTGAVLKTIPLNTTTLTLENPTSCVTDRTRIIAVAHHSNVLGTIWNNNDLTRIIATARQKNIFIMLDMAQCAAHHAIDVQALDVDALAFSGHKMFGPTGIGILYLHKRRHHEIHPYQYGGGMIESVSFTTTRYKNMPERLEAGTPPIASVIGLHEAINFMRNIDFNDLARHEALLTNLLIHELASIPGISIYPSLSSAQDDRHLVSFAVDGIHAHDIAALCADQHLALRAGHHCAQPLVSEILHHESLVRASIACYNNEIDITQSASIIKSAINHLRR